MDFPKIHESEYRFCLIMWKHEPVTARRACKAVPGSTRMEKDYDLYRYQASWRAWCAEERQWHCYFSRFQR